MKNIEKIKICILRNKSVSLLKLKVVKKLKEFSDNEVFYRGTIIVLKDKHISPVGNFDVKYAMIGG